MANKEEGLKQKYHVSRVDGKPLDKCIVLEFKDPIARKAIGKWASEMYKNGYEKVYFDVMEEIVKYEGD